MGGASLSLDPVGRNISLLGDETFLSGNDVYPPEGVSLVASTAKGQINTSKVKQATSLITQEFNFTLKK